MAAVVPIAADMYAPFVVVASESKTGPFLSDRTTFYLVDEFNALYRGRLISLPGWRRWVAAVSSLAPHALGALNAKENLHAHTTAIAGLKATYDTLAIETARRGITWR